MVATHGFLVFARSALLLLALVLVLSPALVAAAAHDDHHHGEHVVTALAPPLSTRSAAAAAASTAAPTAASAGHSHGHGGGHGMSMDRPMTMKDMESFPDYPTYSNTGEHSSMAYAHIGSMTLAWAVVLPLSVMLSIARSRLTLPSQLAFLACHVAGMLTGTIYNTSTPDYYPNNAHHKLGWALTWISGIWILLSAVGAVGIQPSAARPPHQVVSQQAMEEHGRMNAHKHMHAYRWSGDSGHGTERSPASLSSSRTNSWNSEAILPQSRHEDDEEEHEANEQTSFLPESVQFAKRATGGIAKTTRFIYVLIERFLLVLSFVAFLTGLVTYSGISMEGHIFNVLAHLIKGGIFFVYGILTFGRWMGAFADVGWAWNLKPDANMVGSRKARTPSAEFIESAVICFYGASNVFLEHLGAWGKEWSAMDFEHVSITIMFFGGGLLGMLIESRRVRALLSSTVSLQSDYSVSLKEWSAPQSYRHPLNPIPSLVILLLGIMMSNHTQHSQVSGQIHKQWGMLFAGFALSRALTYVILWIKPPESYLPSRPPTELLAAFCLVSGGGIFMASNKDTINALEEYDLDSMFVFTVMMGFSCLVLAYSLVAYAVKAWAGRQPAQVKLTDA